jgi:hypothetical protein
MGPIEMEVRLCVSWRRAVSVRDMGCTPERSGVTPGEASKLSAGPHTPGKRRQRR